MEKCCNFLQKKKKEVNLQFSPRNNVTGRYTLHMLNVSIHADDYNICLCSTELTLLGLYWDVHCMEERLVYYLLKISLPHFRTGENQGKQVPL